MTKEKKRGQLDLLNFAYGLGAAIVIVGAMFKFLGWPYSGHMFVIGLSTEAVVFLISGIEFKSESQRLKWEKVFPQLDPDYKNEDRRIDFSEMHEMYFKNTKQLLDASERLAEAMNKLSRASQKISTTAERMGQGVERMEQSSAEYENEIQKLKERVTRMNEAYENMRESALKELN